MSTPAAIPSTGSAAAAASEGSTSPAGASANDPAPAASGGSPATFLTAPAELPEHDASAPASDIMASLGAPIGTGSSTAEEYPAVRSGGEQPTPLATTDVATTDASTPAAALPADERTPATTALPTATTSTSTAATSDVKAATAAVPSSSPKPAASSSAPAAARPTASTAGEASRPGQKKTKKGGLAGFLASVFPCFPSDDKAYDGAAKKPAASAAHTPPAPTVATSAASTMASEKAAAAAKASKASTASSEKLQGEPLRQITSRELMAVDTTPPAAAGRDKTPKPAAIALPVPTMPLTAKRSTSSLKAGGDVVIPPPTPTSPPIDETAGLTSAAVVPPGSGSLIHSHAHPSQSSSHAPTPTATTPQLAATDAVGSPDESFSATDSEVSGSDAGGQRYEDSQTEGGELYHHDDDEEEEDEDAHLLGGVGIPIGPDGKECPLLPPMSAAHKGRKCLVLDLDETLLHSSFKLIPQADYIVPVEIESQTHNVYVIKRPGVDNFLKRMGEIYEVVVFTASLSKYADPVLDMLDVHHVVSHRLFRESCYNHKGNYVKDLSQLGRPIDETIIIDNSPASYIFHPNNAVPVSTWFNDPHDSELNDLILFLADLANVEDVRGVLDGGL